RLAAGATLISQGVPIDAIYILLEGMLEVTSPGMVGRAVRLGVGEVVGEISLLDRRPPTATVKAATGCHVLAVRRDDLTAKIAEDEGFAARFYQALAVFLAHRLRNTYQQLGYGKNALDEDQEFEGELSAEVLDTMHLAATRFDRALQRLLPR
ncbi:MAG TPA: cyclic nucleotide-binding domain-containing protein, partial [Pirellulales bacterium]